MTPNQALALVLRVQREMRVGATTLGEVGDMLAGAGWLRPESLLLITEIGGKVPLRWSPPDTAVAVTLPGGQGAIYLAIAGRHTLPALVSALSSRGGDASARAALVLDWGLAAPA